jgi:hypothetical protein
MQSAKEATAPLLDLVNGESQKHQLGQNRRQMLCAVPVIMLEMVALIFKCVESLVLNFPARASTAVWAKRCVYALHVLLKPERVSVIFGET